MALDSTSVRVVFTSQHIHVIPYPSQLSYASCPIYIFTEVATSQSHNLVRQTSSSMSHQSGSSSSSDDSDASLESLELDEEYEDFMAEQKAFDSVAEDIEAKLKARYEMETAESSRRRGSSTRIYILRDREHACP